MTLLLASKGEWHLWIWEGLFGVNHHDLKSGNTPLHQLQGYTHIYIYIYTYLYIYEYTYATKCILKIWIYVLSTSFQPRKVTHTHICMYIIYTPNNPPWVPAFFPKTTPLLDTTPPFLNLFQKTNGTLDGFSIFFSRSQGASPIWCRSVEAPLTVPLAWSHKKASNVNLWGKKWRWALWFHCRPYFWESNGV